MQTVDVVYIQDKNGNALMPTKRLGKVTRWLNSGRAVFVGYAPFTIRLLDLDGGHTQPIEAGVDLGTAHVGISAISAQAEILAAEFRLRTDISGLLTERRRFRRSRRNRTCRYRAPRFDNRKHKDELAPSVQAKVEETLKAIKFVRNLLPVTHWTFEVGNFDPHKLANPDVKGEGYQQGPQVDFWNVREYVLHRDRHTCQGCKGKSGDPVLNVHHIRERKNGGSDQPDNLITLCETCHQSHHRGEKPLTLAAPKSLRDATQFNIVKAYVMRATTDLPHSVTFGYITKCGRIELGLPIKSHLNDAFVIAGGCGQRRAKICYLGVFFRRQNRKLFKGDRSHIRNTIPSAKGFKRGDKVRLEDGRVGFIHGLRSSGYFDVRRLTGEVLSHSVGWKRLARLEGAKTIRIEAVLPDRLEAGQKQSCLLEEAAKNIMNI